MRKGLINIPLVAFVVFCLLAITACNKSDIPPNVILINVDDLGWTDLSCNGSDYYETPNIDRLKESGLYFPNAYASASNCAPSRACLISGQFASRHGIYTVYPADRGKSIDRKLIPCETNIVLDTNVITLPEILQSNGYQTCMVGKWHLGDDPKEQGFDINFGGYIKGHPDSYFSPYKNPQLKDGPVGEYLPNRLGNEAANFIKNRDKNKPFFLYYANYEVHTPLQAPKHLIDKYESKEKTDSHNNPIYAAMVEVMDNNIGKVIDMVEQEGLSKNTIIIFTSDNGGVYKVSKQWPLRAGKGSYYEGGIRVPMIINWNGVIKNATNHTLVSQIDLYPTILSLLGIDVPNNLMLDGADLSSNILYNKVSYSNRKLYWHFPAYLQGGNKETADSKFRSRPVSAIREGDWKLILNIEDNSTELYNISNDIGEENDLSKEFNGKNEQLLTQLLEWRRNVNACTPSELNPEYKP